MNQVKVSVIIPVYNTEVYLEQCLDSVLSQSLDDIEVIIVNDCSLDGSSDVINDYAENDSRVFHIDHEVNKGLPEARNSGVSIARGQYIIHLDSDDFWLDKNMLNTLYQTAEIDNCDILKFDGLHADNDNISRPIFKTENIVNGSFKKNREFWSYRSVYLYFFRKNFVDKHNLRFVPGINLGEDAIFLSSALKCANKISSIPDMFYAYRVDNVSLMRKPWALKDYLEEEDAARIVSNNIEGINEPFVNYWAFRLNHYWSTKLIVRAFNDLDYNERQELLAYVSATLDQVDVKEIEESGFLTSVGQNVLKLLIRKDFSALEKFIAKVNMLPCHYSQFSSVLKKISYVKNKLRPLLVMLFWKCKGLLRLILGRIKRIIGRAILKDRVFHNIEGDSDYNFVLTKKGKLLGASAMLRVKNEERRIVSCLESIVDLFDEIVVIDNGSKDSTKELVEKFKVEHVLGDRVVVHSYPFTVAKCGSEHQATEANSLRSLAYYYNWCVSRCGYSVICKWDADMLLGSNMDSREIFRRYILSVVNARQWHIGSIPVQTMYIDAAGNRFISRNEIHQEVRLFPNIPAVYFIKAELWEALQTAFPINNKILDPCVIYELKDVSEDEFSHWSSTTFVGGRKAIEFRNYMRVKKLMHLNDSKEFLSSNGL
ncbi:glycosyltransferase [Amphritea sp. HPY]|uniref:glycosyltransferase n=1 Tax=Amphritea sp. HPY TaxID=3421652 RepID=UPI003D7CB233